LWTRSDLSARSQILSDEHHFYVVELSADNNPSSTRVLRAQDGVSVKAPDFAVLYQKRMRMSGRNLLLFDTDDVKKKVYLRLYDVLAGKDLWKDEFPAKSIALQSEDPNLAGVVEPDGKLHVYDLRKQDKKELFTANLLPKHLEKVHGVTLLSDDKDVYVACNLEFDPQLMPWGGIQSNLMPGTGLRSLAVNGEVYSFTRQGELNWHDPVHNQMLVMEHFKELPVLLFTSRYNKWANQGAARNVVYVVATQSIEKQSGKLKYWNEAVNSQQQQFHTINMDMKAGKIELISWNLKLVHQLLTPNGEKVGEKSGDKGAEKSGTKSGASAGTQEEIEKKAIERLRAEQDQRALEQEIIKLRAIEQERRLKEEQQQRDRQKKDK
jgi:hypothetical protein